MPMNIELLIRIGSQAIPIVRDLAPHIEAFRRFLEERGLEADRAELDRIILDAAERQAVSEGEVAAGSEPPVSPTEG